MTSFNYHHAVKTQVMNHGIMYNIQYNCNATFFYLWERKDLALTRCSIFITGVSINLCIIAHLQFTIINKFYNKLPNFFITAYDFFFFFGTLLSSSKIKLVGNITEFWQKQNSNKT